MEAEQTNNVKPGDVDLVALNEGLMLGLVRQHGLTEAAELLNVLLQNEISARKKAEDALIRSEKLASVGRMAAVLAHEINNPLEAVMNLLFITKSTAGLPDAVRNYLEMADGELKRIAHITRQTLGFYRESSAPTTFHVSSLFESVVDLLQCKDRCETGDRDEPMQARSAADGFPGRASASYLKLFGEQSGRYPGGRQSDPASRAFIGRQAWPTSHQDLNC